LLLRGDFCVRQIPSAFYSPRRFHLSNPPALCALRNVSPESFSTYLERELKMAAERKHDYGLPAEWRLSTF
jgi:hypothetical protein